MSISSNVSLNLSFWLENVILNFEFFYAVGSISSSGEPTLVLPASQTSSVTQSPAPSIITVVSNRDNVAPITELPALPPPPAVPEMEGQV